MKVQFELIKNGSMIVYPDDINLFSNAQIVGQIVVADYFGSLNLDAYAEPAAPIQTVISKLAFRRLFSVAEKVAFDNFESNAALIDDQKQYLRTLTKDFEQAEQIDMADPDTASGLAFLETCGILETGKTAQIMAGFGL